MTTTIDPTSLSNGYQVTLNHITFDWTIDFDAEKIGGYVELDISFKADVPRDKVVLDTRELTVFSVQLGSRELDFEFGSAHPIFGTPLVISIPDNNVQNIKLRVNYSTAAGDKATALQWLPIEQTADKKHPFLFSQCQAIHARSLFPCFDHPAQKFTYNATVRCPDSCTALMSAISTSQRVGIFTFEQKVPLCSYLVAICVGVLGSADVGPRSKVYSEPSLVKACAFEFAETEKFLSTAEKLLGPYVWGRYDLLILPPSFPYGGMENPCMNFVTPTLLAGDRSLVNVVVHEQSHSWTGNLVTNETWEHFWLNEGMTVFCERKIMTEILSDKKLGFDLDALIGMDSLQESVDLFGATDPFTCLYIDHSVNGGIDPDDAFSNVPYEKGFSFLVTLENMVQAKDENNNFMDFVREYVANFKFKTVNASQFRSFFENYFGADIVSDAVWNKWLFEPGMVDVEALGFDRTYYDLAVSAANKLVDGGSGGCGCGTLSSLFSTIKTQVQEKTDFALETLSNPKKAGGKAKINQSQPAILARNVSKCCCCLPRLNCFSCADTVEDVEFVDIDAAEWTTNVKLVWLETLNGLADDGKLTKARCEEIEEHYGMQARTSNAEIGFQWLMLCLKCDRLSDPAVKASVEEFLTRQGRMKFTRPLYRELAVKDKEYAVEFFLKNKTIYHVICQKLVSRDLGLEE